jgi:hypothetical protein
LRKTLFFDFNLSSLWIPPGTLTLFELIFQE